MCITIQLNIYCNCIVDSESVVSNNNNGPKYDNAIKKMICNSRLAAQFFGYTYSAVLLIYLIYHVIVS